MDYHFLGMPGCGWRLRRWVSSKRGSSRMVGCEVLDLNFSPSGIWRNNTICRYTGNLSGVLDWLVTAGLRERLLLLLLLLLVMIDASPTVSRRLLRGSRVRLRTVTRGSLVLPLSRDSIRWCRCSASRALRKGPSLHRHFTATTDRVFCNSTSSGGSCFFPLLLCLLLRGLGPLIVEGEL